MDSGNFRRTDEKMTCYCIASMIARIRIWYSPGGERSIDEISEFIYSFVMEGLRPGS